jgi:proteasome alpha subunit
VTMPFYVSPEQAMKDKADYARKAITRIRSGVVMTCDAGILFVAPNPSRALRKFSEIYDRIAFAAVGRYNEFENLRKAGVRYADMTGFQYDRQDVTARGLANWYAQLLGTIFTESPKPYEVEIVVAEVGKIQDDDQIYRITFDGSVADEHGFVVMGGQADQVAAVLKDKYSDGMTLSQAFTTAIQALAGPVKGEGAAGGGDRNDITAAQLEVALLDRGRSHRTFRRLTGARLETLLGEAIPGKKTEAIAEGAGAADQGADDSAGAAGQGSGGNGQKGKGPDGSSGKTDAPGDATD